ncbi:unnamed protein product [Linum trigynum]|uniref:Uncharacterized protein n=1 Tax=Linum trigynum TaxID=586398 RepID=A0AAV2DG78_9ROSI
MCSLLQSQIADCVVLPLPNRRPRCKVPPLLRLHSGNRQMLQLASSAQAAPFLHWCNGAVIPLDAWCPSPTHAAQSGRAAFTASLLTPSPIRSPPPLFFSYG